jgi:hypothetical protein
VFSNTPRSCGREFDISQQVLNRQWTWRQHVFHSPYRLPDCYELEPLQRFPTGGMSEFDNGR